MIDEFGYMKYHWLSCINCCEMIKLHFIRYNNKMAHYGRAEYWEERYSKDA